SITRTGGDLWQDVMMASKGISSAMSGISGVAGLAAGLGKGAVNAVQGKGDWHENFARPIQQYGQKHPVAGGIPSTIASGVEAADGVVTTVTTLGQKIATASKASNDVSMPDSTRAVKQSGEKASNYNDQSHYTAAEKMIKNSAVGADALNSGKVEALRVNSDGSMSADVISRGKDGNVVSKSEFAVSTDADGQPSIVPIKKTEFGSSVDGTVGIVTDSEKGKFQVTRTGVNPKNGNEQWEATQVADANGIPIANDDMVSQPFEMRKERDSEGNVIANTSDNAARQFVNNGGVETLSASTTAHIAENESFAQDLQIAKQDIAQTDEERINQFSNPDAARNYNDDSHKMAMKEKLADVGYDGGIAAGENSVVTYVKMDNDGSLKGTVRKVEENVVTESRFVSSSNDAAPFVETSSKYTDFPSKQSGILEGENFGSALFSCERTYADGSMDVAVTRIVDKDGVSGGYNKAIVHAKGSKDSPATISGVAQNFRVSDDTLGSGNGFDDILQKLMQKKS
ncbi:MAG: hypothetical protein RR415_14030, partial [Ruthenibacterium sp.]